MAHYSQSINNPQPTFAWNSLPNLPELTGDHFKIFAFANLSVIIST